MTVSQDQTNERISNKYLWSSYSVATGLAVLRVKFMFALPMSAMEQTCSKYENVTLTVYNRGEIKMQQPRLVEKYLTEVGFEPTPPKRLEP